MKKILIVVVALIISGCAPALQILDIIADDPKPVCDKDSAGTEFQGKVCLKYGAGSYRWVIK